MRLSCVFPAFFSPPRQNFSDKRQKFHLNFNGVGKIIKNLSSLLLIKNGKALKIVFLFEIVKTNLKRIFRWQRSIEKLFYYNYYIINKIGIGGFHFHLPSDLVFFFFLDFYFFKLPAGREMKSSYLDTKSKAYNGAIYFIYASN